MRRLSVLLVVPMLLVACSDDESATPTTPSAPPTECVTTPAPDGRLVHVTLDDTVGGFGGLGSRSNSGLTPGTVRVELEADAENATPSGIRVQLDGVDVADIHGVAAADTCGIDLEVVVGTYHVLDDVGHDVEFAVAADG